jgi:Uma2 family endonuclease
MTALTLPLTVDLKHVHLTDEQFYQLCINNPELSIERSAKGILVVMPLVGGDDSNRQVEFGTDLGIWNRQTQLGSIPLLQMSASFPRRWESITEAKYRWIPICTGMTDRVAQ